ncbi:MAG: LPS export ABC transporter periplasmic protein LptC [Nitrospirae bacterium]|nr:LPS export ABC transporter periplasmic protein LptC [Nitrospirota bacterium]MBI5696211.1 LPS export ABC transporter periplasmic protein LptC [Nitrospirota bacterium]
MRYATKAKLFLTAAILTLVSVSIAYLIDKPGRKEPVPVSRSMKTDGAEVVIDQFHFANSESDKVSWELSAARAEMRKDEGMARLRDLKAVFNGRDGMVLTLVADGGTFEEGTRAITLGGGDGPVTLTSSNGYTMSAEDLSWDDVKKTLSTDNHITIKGSAIDIEGRGMVARADLQEVRITDGVRTVFRQGGKGR